MSKNEIRVALLALFLSGLWLTSALASGGGGGASVVAVQNSDGTIIATNSGGTVTVSRAAVTGDFSIPSASNVGTLANVNSNVGTYNGITINAKGQVTGAVAGIHLGTSCAAANPNASAQADLGLSTDNTNLFVCADITSTPTQVAEFGPTGLTLPLLTPSTLLGLNGTNQVINVTSIPSGTTLSVGTSAAAANPQRNGQPGTGIYSAASGTVSIAGAGSDVADFSSAGEALHLGSYSGAGTGLTGTAAALSVGGNAATATALAAAPSGCTAGQFVTQISANGTPTCGAPSGSGYVAGPGSSTVGYASLWSNTAGTALGVGLPVATTGNSTIVETSSGGLISASIVPTLNQNTTGNAGSSSLIATNSSTANSTFYFLGAGSTTNSNQAATLGSGLSFNPSTSSITATTFNGALAGNSSTATALASAPSGCSAGSFVTQISANGTPTCATPATSGYVSGPGTTNSGYLPAWSNTTGTTLGAGLPVGTTGNNTVVETNGSGQIASSIVPTLNQNTTGSAGSATLVATTSSTTNASYPLLAVASSTNSNQAASLNSSVSMNPSTGVVTVASTNATATTYDTLPVGSTSQRPGSGAVGEVRYNNTWGGLETYIGARWQSFSDPPNVFRVALYGALGVSSDDGAAINSAITAAEAYGKGGKVVFDGIHYAILSGLTSDPETVRFDFNGAQLDATGMSNGTGPFWTFTGNSSDPDNTGQTNLKNDFAYGDFIGPTSSSTNVDAFVYNGSGTTANANFMDIHNIHVNAFRHVDVYESNAYLIGHTDMSYTNQQGSAIYLPTGFSNNDENISYTRGAIAQGASYAVDSESTNGTNIVMFGTSLDFNAYFFNILGGHADCIGCHLEMQGSALTTTPVINIANFTGAQLNLIGGDFVPDGTGPFSGGTVWATVGAAGALNMNNVFVNNVALTSGWFAGGAGRVNVREPGQFTVPNGYTTLMDATNTNTNLLLDPTFAAATLKDPWFVTGDSYPVVDPLTSSTFTLASDNSATCSGAGPTGNTDAQGMLFTKGSGGNGTPASFALIIPMDRGAQMLSSLYYQKPGTGTGQIFIQTNWAMIDGYQNGLPHLRATSQIALASPTFTSAAVGWTALGGGGQFEGFAPPGYNALEISVNANGLDAGTTLCIGHVTVNEVRP